MYIYIIVTYLPINVHSQIKRTFLFTNDGHLIWRKWRSGIQTLYVDETRNLSRLRDGQHMKRVALELIYCLLCVVVLISIRLAVIVHSMSAWITATPLHGIYDNLRLIEHIHSSHSESYRKIKAGHYEARFSCMRWKWLHFMHAKFKWDNTFTVIQCTVWQYDPNAAFWYLLQLSKLKRLKLMLATCEKRMNLVRNHII